jgi:FimV-like protein
MYRQLPWVLGGSLSRAEGYLLRAIELDPNAVGARIELARTYCDMGTPDRAVPLLRKAQQLAEQMGKHRQIRQARELLSQLGH